MIIILHFTLYYYIRWEVKEKIFIIYSTRSIARTNSKNIYH